MWLTGVAGLAGGIVLLKNHFTIAGVLVTGVGVVFMWLGQADGVQRKVDEEAARLAAAQAETDAIARTERREQAALAALKASIDATPAYHQETDEPIKPGVGAPFRDNFQTVAERVVRPSLAEPSPTSGISTAAAADDVTAPKLLK
ncbi:MAG TPA: hypothetical protein PLF40_14430 [Kofleriaceae bacterium]|nr:hypothetical protein [Kofleriaceae bacterium]